MKRLKTEKHSTTDQHDPESLSANATNSSLSMFKLHGTHRSTEWLFKYFFQKFLLMPISPLEDKENQGGRWGEGGATGQGGEVLRKTGNKKEQQTYLYRII